MSTVPQIERVAGESPGPVARDIRNIWMITRAQSGLDINERMLLGEIESCDQRLIGRGEREGRLRIAFRERRIVDRIDRLATGNDGSKQSKGAKEGSQSY